MYIKFDFKEYIVAKTKQNKQKMNTKKSLSILLSYTCKINIKLNVN